ncbi:MAG: hypothetical protein IH795_13270, partial [Bacteroidetes bacterium]|nr:hypothetical protein [Bacteroidota bacterium]
MKWKSKILTYSSISFLLCFTVVASKPESSEILSYLAVHGSQGKVNRGTRFVIFGHTYNTIKDSVKRNLFIKSINSEEPDYVLVLGDSDAWNSTIADQYR